MIGLFWDYDLFLKEVWLVRWGNSLYFILCKLKVFRGFLKEKYVVLGFKVYIK